MNGDGVVVHAARGADDGDGDGDGDGDDGGDGDGGDGDDGDDGDDDDDVASKEIAVSRVLSSAEVHWHIDAG